MKDTKEMMEEQTMNNEEFNEFEGQFEAAVEQQTEHGPVVVKRHGLVGWFNGLKTWQKIAIVGGVGTGLVLGGRHVYKVVKNNKEAVAQAAKAACEMDNKQILGIAEKATEVIAENPEIVTSVVE